MFPCNTALHSNLLRSTLTFRTLPYSARLCAWCSLLGTVILKAKCLRATCGTARNRRVFLRLKTCPSCSRTGRRGSASREDTSSCACPTTHTNPWSSRYYHSRHTYIYARTHTSFFPNSMLLLKKQCQYYYHSRQTSHATAVLEAEVEVVEAEEPH